MFDVIYVVVNNSITCQLCQRTSSNLNDVAHRYCGNCHLFLMDVLEARMQAAGGASHDCYEWPTALGKCAICGQVIKDIE